MRSSDVLPHPFGPSSSQRSPVSNVEVDVVEDRGVVTTKRMPRRRERLQLGMSRRSKLAVVSRPRRAGRHDRHPTETHRLHSRAVTWRRARFVHRGASRRLGRSAVGTRRWAAARRPRATTMPRLGLPPRSRRPATGPTPPPPRGRRRASSSTRSTRRSTELQAEYDVLQAEVDELRSETEQVAINRYMAAGAGAMTIFEGPQASTDQIVANELVATATNSSTTAMDEYAVAAARPRGAARGARGQAGRARGASATPTPTRARSRRGRGRTTPGDRGTAPRGRAGATHPRGPARRGDAPAAGRSRGALRPRPPPSDNQPVARRQAPAMRRRRQPSPGAAAAARRSGAVGRQRRRRRAGDSRADHDDDADEGRADSRPLRRRRRRRRRPHRPTEPPRSGIACPVRGSAYSDTWGRLALRRAQSPGRRHARRHRDADRRRRVRLGAVQADQPRRQLGVARRQRRQPLLLRPPQRASPAPVVRCRRAR